MLIILVLVTYTCSLNKEYFLNRELFRHLLFKKFEHVTETKPLFKNKKAQTRITNLYIKYVAFLYKGQLADSIDEGIDDNFNSCSRKASKITDDRAKGLQN